MSRVEKLDCELGESLSQRAAIGIIVAATDQTIERELSQLLRFDGVAHYVTRIYNSSQITANTMVNMEADIAVAAGLIVPNLDIDAIAFACTSAATLIGVDQVYDRIHETRPDVACTTPISAVDAALKALKVRRIGYLSPYGPSVNSAICRWLEDSGYDISFLASYEEEDDTKVANISPVSLKKGVCDIARSGLVDAIFISCTSLRVAHLIADLEEELGIPIISSTQAMAWHCLRLAGVQDDKPSLGRLYSMQILENVNNAQPIDARRYNKTVSDI